LKEGFPFQLADNVLVITLCAIVENHIIFNSLIFEPITNHAMH